MLFYNFDILDNFINDNLINSIKLEKDKITQLLNLYHNKKINLMAMTTNMLEAANSIGNNKLNDFYDTIHLLKKSFESIEKIENLASRLCEDLTSTISLYDKSLDNNSNEIKANLIEYNKQKDNLTNQIIEFENMNTTILNSTIELFLKTYHNKKKKKQNLVFVKSFVNHRPKIDIEINHEDNNILIISEKEQKAYLPFYYSEVETIFKNSSNQYATLQDVVNDLYIVPLSKFKNSAISRFRESFQLIRDKEKGSITKALDLGLELMFQYELNPIIIAACRNLDELDIYLDCLEENQLYDFSCFEIKFEVSPQLRIKRHAKNS